MRPIVALIATTAVGLALAAPANAAVPASVANVPVVYAPCPGLDWAPGCVYDGTVYVAQRGDKATLYHELGHVWAERRLTDPASQAWFTSRLRTQLPWHAVKVGRPSGEELFADAFMLCAQNYRFHPGQSTDTGYGYSPTPRQHRTICNAIAVLDIAR